MMLISICHFSSVYFHDLRKLVLFFIFYHFLVSMQNPIEIRPFEGTKLRKRSKNWRRQINSTKMSNLAMKIWISIRRRAISLRQRELGPWGLIIRNRNLSISINSSRWFNWMKMILKILETFFIFKVQIFIFQSKFYFLHIFIHQFKIKMEDRPILLTVLTDHERKLFADEVI